MENDQAHDRFFAETLAEIAELTGADPLGPAGRHIPVRVIGECWPWMGALTDAGYGRVKIAGKARMAHRAVYEAVCGAIQPASAFVLHSCDTPRCCNPAHLTLGDAKRNAQEMVIRGRDQHAKRRGYALSRPLWCGQIPKPR